MQSTEIQLPTVTITRTDPLAGIPEPEILSRQEYKGWPSVLTALSEYGVSLTPEQEIEITKHPDTHFVRHEFINKGFCAYMASVHYDIRVI